MDYVTYYAYDSEDPFTIDLDPETDFYNRGHVNFYGAEKFTDVLAAYLHENYDLPDRRNDPVAQEHWDGLYENILKTMENYIANPSTKPVPEEEEDEGE